MIADRHWLKRRRQLVGFVEAFFLLAEREEFPTIRECATALKLPQKDILALAEDAKDGGELEINTGLRSGGGFASFADPRDFMLEPMHEVMLDPFYGVDYEAD